MISRTRVRLWTVATGVLLLSSFWLGCDGGSGTPINQDTGVTNPDGVASDIGEDIRADMASTDSTGDSPDGKTDEALLPDCIPPTIVLKTPKDGALVTGMVLIEVEAEDDEGLKNVEILIQDELSATLETKPYEHEWNTGGLIAGEYKITVIAYDHSGNTAEDSAVVQVQAECDEDGDCPPKSVKIINPVDGATVCGDFTIEATAQDDKGITEIEFFVDEDSLGVDVESPFQKKWDTTAFEHGDHTLKVIARDTVGHEAFATTSVKVDNTGATCDNLPSVTIEQPSNGAYVDGEVEIIISASDDIGVLNVQIFIDNALVAEDKMAPYKVTWDTTEFDEGAHTIKAIAYDTSDQMGQIQIQVTVDRTPPQVEILSPTWEEIYNDLVPIDIEALDNFVVQYVEVWVDGDEVVVFEETPYTFDFDSTDIWGGEHKLEVMAVDGAGHMEWADMWFTIDRPPVVSIIAPQGDSAVFGDVEVVAEVAEDVDLGSVVLYLDGEQLGYMDSDWGQYTYIWNTPYAKATHTLTVVAMDEAGQEDTAEVSVTVDYPVTVSLKDCTSGQCFDFIAEQEVAGILALHAEASDDGEDIANVELHIDSLLEQVDSTDPYDFEWDSTNVDDGIHTITAVAKNTLDETDQVSVDVLVNNCDKDYDGYLALECGGSDCNDLDLNLNPGEPDTVGNEIDENCDGLDGVDGDGDGTPSVASGGTDCDDNNDETGECQCYETCLNQVCVFTSCVDVECGPDGCGGNCGSCGCGEICTEGQCISNACLGKECGPDGCGYSCGDCLQGELCEAGICIQNDSLCLDGLQCSGGFVEGFLACLDDGEIPSDSNYGCQETGCMGNASCHWMNGEQTESVCLDNCGECPQGTTCMDVTGDGYLGCLVGGYVPEGNPMNCHIDGCPGNDTCFFLNLEKTESVCIANCSPCKPGTCGAGMVCVDGMCEDEPCTEGSCLDDEICLNGTCVPDMGDGPGPGPGPDCDLPPLICEGSPAYCGELIQFDPDNNPSEAGYDETLGYVDFPENGETWTNQYRSWLRRDTIMMIQYASAYVACKAADWSFGNGGPIGLIDMSEEDGSIPGTSIGMPGHPPGTHTNGFDIDAAYYQVNTPDNRPRPVCDHYEGGQEAYHCTAPPHLLDPWRTALFIGALQQHPDLRVIGCDGKVGPMVMDAMQVLCADGWLSPFACNNDSLTYEEENMGYGWFLFHHHNMHISFNGTSSPGAP